jgi:hypothetical protein
MQKVNFMSYSAKSRVFSSSLDVLLRMKHEKQLCFAIGMLKAYFKCRDGSQVDWAAVVRGKLLQGSLRNNCGLQVLELLC